MITTPADAPLGIRVARLPAQALIDLFKYTGHWLRGRNMPLDARVVKVGLDTFPTSTSTEVVLWLESAEWPEVAEGTLIPTHLLLVESTALDPRATTEAQGEHS